MENFKPTDNIEITFRPSEAVKTAAVAHDGAKYGKFDYALYMAGGLLILTVILTFPLAVSTFGSVHE
jgi:hypothetical protein